MDGLMERLKMIEIALILNFVMLLLLTSRLLLVFYSKKRVEMVSR